MVKRFYVLNGLGQSEFIFHASNKHKTSGVVKRFDGKATKSYFCLNDLEGGDQKNLLDDAFGRNGQHAL
ncbi:MAG: hypothetical protein RLY35_1733 [Bacteroidota bacterium]